LCFTRIELQSLMFYINFTSKRIVQLGISLKLWQDKISIIKVSFYGLVSHSFMLNQQYNLENKFELPNQK